MQECNTHAAPTTYPRRQDKVANIANSDSHDSLTKPDREPAGRSPLSEEWPKFFLIPLQELFLFFPPLLLSHSVSDSAPGRWNENVYRGTCALDLSFPAIPCFLIYPPTSPDHPCHREAASESVRATWCKSKREEKRTWSGSIRRASKRDAESERDGGSGSNDVVEARGEKRKRKSGREGIQMWERWEVGNEIDEERQSHRAFPGPRLAT